MNPMQDFGSGPGGPMISGKWIDKRNGRVITVRDSIIDGDSMVIISDHGNIPMMEFQKFYIQESEEVYDLTGKVVGTEKISSTDVIGKETSPIETKTVSVEEYKNPLTTPVSQLKENTNKKPAISSTSTVEVHVKENGKPLNGENLIEKIFNKIDIKPNITIDIDWADFPISELKMLVDYFDITNKDIAEYINKHFVNDSTVIESIKNFVDHKMGQ